LFYTLFPRLRARTFDIYNDDDWIRTGRAIARMHCAVKKSSAPHRLQCTPQQTTTPYIQYLLNEKLVTPELVPQFEQVCDSALDYIEEAYRECFGECDKHDFYHTTLFQRIHGDCHRGNILEQFVSSSPARVNGKTGVDTESGEQSEITFIDFDDMMTGPAMQDIWLLLPGYRAESMRELTLLLEGYEEFSSSQKLYAQVRLIEPLRFMRNIYFLAWTALQHNDKGFEERNPGWGTRAFWEKEIEDLNEQAIVLKSEYEYFSEVC
jgi:Ser/Thr protein kinase RdoA (MazF antagonist)